VFAHTHTPLLRFSGLWINLFSFLMLLTTISVHAQVEYPPDYLDASPKMFYENKGQIIDDMSNLRNDVKYYTTALSPNVYLFDDGKMSLVQVHGGNDTIPDTLSRIDFQLVGEAFQRAEVNASNKSTDYRNYYLPHCSNGATYCYAYEKFNYREVYPNIDFEVRANQQWGKYYFIVHPGGNPNDIEFEFTGQDSANIDPYWLELYYHTDILELPNAIAYELNSNGSMSPVNWSPAFLNLGNGKIGFQTGSYNGNKDLVIQLAPPMMMQAPYYYNDNNDWTTYSGGSNEDWFNDVVTDDSGNILVTGETKSTNYPNTTGTIINVGYSAMLVQKFSYFAELKWVTILGGSRADGGNAIDVINNDVYVVGYSFSDDIPPLPPSGANVFYDGVNLYNVNATPFGNDSDGLIVKLNNSTGIPDFNTYIGLVGDNHCYDIEIASNEHIYVVGEGPIQNSTGLGNGFIMEFNADFVPLWGTQIGSTNDISLVRAIATTANNQFYVVGIVNANGLQMSQSNNVAINGYQKPGGIDPTGYNDIFIAKYNNSTNHQIDWCTFYGGTSDEYIGDVVIDDNGDIYVIGSTISSNFETYKQPNTNPTYYPNKLGGVTDAFFMKFSSVGQRLWSTYYGGNNGDSGSKIAIADGVVYFVGTTYSPNFLLKQWTNKNFYYNNQLNSLPNYAAGGDAFIVGIAESDLKTRISTYYGGHGNGVNPMVNRDFGTSITSDGSRLYLVGKTESTFFPTRDYDPTKTTDYYDNTFNGGLFDGFIARFVAPWNVVNTVELNEIQETFKIFPNPSGGVFNITFSEITTDNAKVLVYSLEGRLLKSSFLESGSASLSLVEYPKGQYIVKLVTNKATYSQMIQIY
jgi:hypothetical protein